MIMHPYNYIILTVVCYKLFDYFLSLQNYNISSVAMGNLTRVDHAHYMRRIYVKFNEDLDKTDPLYNFNKYIESLPEKPPTGMSSSFKAHPHLIEKTWTGRYIHKNSSFESIFSSLR